MSVPSRIVSRFRGLGRLLVQASRPPVRVGSIPISETTPADVFIVAYPKSGITWFQSLVAGAVFGLDPEQAPDTLIQDLVPDVHYKPFYKRYRTPMFFKSHHLPRPAYCRVVYLLRDGRDAMVSYWHHLRALGKGSDFAQMIGGEGLFPCKWHEHVEQWTANPFAARTLTIRYEDLQRDAAAELARFCDFVEEPREESHLERVAQQCSFAAMKKREQRFGWDNPDWPRDKPFVRRGIAGSHKDEMPAEAHTLFLEEAWDTLRRFGYC